MLQKINKKYKPTTFVNGAKITHTENVFKLTLIFLLYVA